jgi:hypothetical protein
MTGGKGGGGNKIEILWPLSESRGLDADRAGLCHMGR